MRACWVMARPVSFILPHDTARSVRRIRMTTLLSSYLGQSSQFCGTPADKHSDSQPAAALSMPPKRGLKRTLSQETKEQRVVIQKRITTKAKARAPAPAGKGARKTKEQTRPIEPEIPPQEEEEEHAWSMDSGEENDCEGEEEEEEGESEQDEASPARNFSETDRLVSGSAKRLKASEGGPPFDRRKTPPAKKQSTLTCRICMTSSKDRPLFIDIC